jgi:hypothetical protein
VYEVKRDRAYDHFRLAHQMGMEYDLKAEDIAASKYDFSHALRDRMVQMSWEATPSTKTGRSLPGIHAAPIAQKFEYLQAVRSAITEDGRNVIADMAGLPQGTTIEGYSAWLGEIGAGAQTLVPVPSEGAGKARAIKPVAAKILDLASNIYGFVMEQDAVVYHTPVWDDAKKRHNGIQLTSTRPLTHAEMQQLYGAIHAKFGTWDLAPAYRPDGARVLNFTDIDNAAFHKGLKEVIEALPDEFGGGTIELKRSAPTATTFPTTGQRTPMAKVIWRKSQPQSPIYSQGSSISVPVSRPSTETSPQGTDGTLSPSPMPKPSKTRSSRQPPRQ